ncbi:flagellar hook-basal body complex protein FliE [Domibacillus mangrovi]|uniref:Flagellar hook-basal body complex protein FliE n=1 Tax=Domibacillus mangrovi TaxID=1714354 RepID=A0A1Q5P4W1_9BACI|nr:flagellar hook-basal body complex protein FliE [Domibacillus mangrovi]OKL37142.1 flagellar hook-basal body complex protein FliE [Domibacillus mangrovi]
MAIEGLHVVSPNLIQSGSLKKVSTPYEAQQKFANFLKDSLNDVMKTEVESNTMTDKMIRGENVDIHQVMTAAQKSGITMQLTIEMRNKAVEAYQEIMRMQI